MSEALNALASRDMTAAEVSRHLTRKGFDAESIAATVSELAQHGLVQDERTAGFVVEEVRTSRFKGRLAAAEKLEKRGVDARVAVDALAELDPAQDRLKAIALLRSKSWKNLAQAARALAATAATPDVARRAVHRVRVR